MDAYVVGVRSRRCFVAGLIVGRVTNTFTPYHLVHCQCMAACHPKFNFEISRSLADITCVTGTQLSSILSR